MEKKPYSSATQILLIIAASIFVVEAVVMFILYFIPHESVVVHALIDSSILVILLSPVLYFFLFRPMLTHISERRKVEADLRAEHDTVQRYLDIAGAMILVLDTHGKVVLINRRGREILGLDEKDILGRHWVSNFIPRKDREDAARAFLAVLSGDMGRGERFECPVVTRDGHERVLLWHNTPVYAEGVIKGTLSSAEDITERKRAEEALRESETRYRLLHDMAFDAIIVADARDRVVDCNPAAEEVFGYARGELKGARVSDLMPPEYRERHSEGLRKFLATGQSAIQGKVMELEGLRKNGEVFPIELILNSFSLDDGVYFTGTIRDITARKRAEKEKELMQARLNQKQKMEAIGTLAGGIAHDFNNTLTAIRGNAELLFEEIAKDHPAYGRLREIMGVVDHAARLTKQLLLLSRGQPFKLEPVNINSVVEDSFSMMSRIIGGNIKVSVSLDPGAWTVEADAGNIVQVLMNLAVNARDAMPGGGQLTIRTENVLVDEDFVREVPDARPGRAICVTVEDTGTGMSREVVQRIFEPFFSTKERGKGTGLGLAVVYGIVKQHSGWITVESEPGKGSAFRVYIPALEAPVATAAGQGAGGGPRRVLVVEENVRVREVTRKALEDAGYAVTDFGSYEDAAGSIDKLRLEPDLVVCGLVLPDSAGIECVERFASAHPSTPILIATGYNAEAWDLRALKLPNVTVLRKPYSMLELVESVGRALGARNEAAGAER